MEIKEINLRYSKLADGDCCLSCGGAMNYAEPQPGEVCVDLGSGRGTDVLRLAEMVGSNGFAYGIDIAEGMLKKAQSNAEKLGITNVKFLQKELDNTSLDANSVDLVLSNCTINHASDKQGVWNEIYRILKNGGRFVVSDIYSISEIADEYRNDPVAVAECWAGSVTREKYMYQLEMAGFSSITILEESTPYLKGKAEVASFTILGKKSGCSCGCK